MDPVPRPASPGSLLLPRGFAFLLDAGAATFFAARLAEHLPFGAPTALTLMVEALGLIGWWFLLERRWGTTPGKRLAGLEVVAEHGGRAAPRGLLVRAMALAVLVGADPLRWLDALTGGRVPFALGMLHPGLAAAYVVHALVANSRPGGRTLHDAWSGTRVARRGESVPTASLAWPPPRLATVLLTLGAAGALAFGVWSKEGPDFGRLWPARAAPPSVDREFERLIREEAGVRCRVSTKGTVRFRAGEPTLRVSRMDVSLPWSAFESDKADSAALVVLDRMRADPQRWDRIHVVLHARRTILFMTWNHRWQWYGAFDAIAGRWREAPPDHGAEDED